MVVPRINRTPLVFGVFFGMPRSRPLIFVLCIILPHRGLAGSTALSVITTRPRWCGLNTNTTPITAQQRQANKPLLRHTVLSMMNLIIVHQLSRLTTPVLVFFVFSPTSISCLFFSLFCHQPSGNISKTCGLLANDHTTLSH